MKFITIKTTEHLEPLVIMELQQICCLKCKSLMNPNYCYEVYDYYCPKCQQELLLEDDTMIIDESKTDFYQDWLSEQNPIDIGEQHPQFLKQTIF